MHPALRQQAFFSFNKANCDGDYTIRFFIFWQNRKCLCFLYFFMRRLESLKFSGETFSTHFLDLGVIIVSADQHDFKSNAQDEEQNNQFSFFYFPSRQFWLKVVFQPFAISRTKTRDKKICTFSCRAWPSTGAQYNLWREYSFKKMPKKWFTRIMR